jgi:S-adenosylmethionine hydrolase
MRPIALITDFQQSEYAGILKGVLLRDAPGVPIVDLFHGVSPQGVREGAWVLSVAASFFPDGTIFVGVVDPGVGGARRGVAIFTRRFAFIGPDNGLLYPAAVADGLDRAISLDIPSDASPTFHGRDVFAPAAARLARGDSLEGAAIADLVGLAFHLFGREGEVVRIDPFGNIITNVPPEPGRASYRLKLGRLEATLPWVPTYAAAPEGELVVVTGSAGTLEIAMREKSADAKLAPELGQRIALV